MDDHFKIRIEAHPLPYADFVMLDVGRSIPNIAFVFLSDFKSGKGDQMKRPPELKLLSRRTFWDILHMKSERQAKICQS